MTKNGALMKMIIRIDGSKSLFTTDCFVVKEKSSQSVDDE